MRIEKYGVVLRRIGEIDLELIRYWRNASHVRLNMEYKEIISSENQINWFRKIRPEKDIYFIFSNQETDIGVVNIKDIDMGNLTAETGIFTGNTEFLGCPEPVWAVMTMMDYCFETLGLKILRAKINLNSSKGMSFNHALGYTQTEVNKNGFSYFEVNKEKYERAIAWLKRDSFQ